MPWQFWIDRGGTFTDVVARYPDGQLSQHKRLSEGWAGDAGLAVIRDCLGLGADETIPTGLIEAVKVGTTVGTNALLTGHGESTLLMTTAGFADALEIGDQARPDIFALDIKKPAPLYSGVIEADERVDKQGEVLRELDADKLLIALQMAHRTGLRSCAIAFLHAWKNPTHELRAGELARAVGFTQISLSHQTSPLIKFIPRAETAVLDASLSPPVRRYVEALRSELPTDCRLEFMQSNGGLVDAANFRGKDSVLSGPAGGLTGMAKVGCSAGFDKLIGFDMGGTSTDVSLYAGEFERTLDTRVAGHRLRVPMLGVHTVAAGGGSILTFADGRLRVGPDSAGSLPGPASYRRGGPLTVTDANLLLGRLQVDCFPAVFGESGDQTLDRALVEVGFANLCAELNQQLAVDYSPERLAAGCIDIAIEQMADAIRHISLARGVNPADFTLVSFGGAGGQHACAVAARLGIARVLVSPYASVLSAYGIGLAEQREIVQTAVECPLSETLPPVPTGDRHRVLLRYAGADSVLAVPLAAPEQLRAAFHAEHRQRFGFADPARELVCVAIESESIRGGGEARPVCSTAPRPALPFARRPVFSQGQWLDTALYRYAELAAGQHIAGPALIVEAGSTLWLEPGWQAQLSPRGDLVLESHTPQQLRPDPARVDPTWLTLFNRRFMSIAEDMGRVLQNAARSVNIRERLDFSCALFDREANLIANAPHIPVHLGSMGDAVLAIRQRFAASMRPGDAYLINCPYAGGTHLPDITVVMPVFGEDGNELRYFTAARAHHADVGGISPGSMPAYSQHIDEEGCRSDGLLMLRDGQLLETDLRNWLHSSPWPARNIEQNLADLGAQVAACQLGARLLRQLEEEVGAAAVPAYMGHVQDHAEQAVRRLLGRLHDARFDLPLDDGSHIRVAIHIAAQHAIIDFNGTSAQQSGNRNAPASIARSAVLYVFRTLLDEDIPLNAGVLRPLQLVLPEGSLLNPIYPAAVVAGNVETSQALVDALYGALGALAASQGSMNNLSFGDGRHQYYETLCGGAGAGPCFNGASAVHTHMTNSRLTDPEVLEVNFPVRLEQFAVRRGSGGGGRWQGGDGIVRTLRFLAPMQGNLIASRRIVAPFGLQGGGPAVVGRQWLERANGAREELAGVASFQVEAGDRLVIETPGGGGFGKAEVKT